MLRSLTCSILHFGLNLNDANAIAEKIEGLAWGPDLPDGRHVLYVTSDNDLNPNLATQIYAFAIDAVTPQLREAVPTTTYLSSMAGPSAMR